MWRLGEIFLRQFIWKKLSWDSHLPPYILTHTNPVRETSMGSFRRHDMSPWQLRFGGQVLTLSQEINLVLMNRQRGD